VSVETVFIIRQMLIVLEVLIMAHANYRRWQTPRPMLDQHTELPLVMHIYFTNVNISTKSHMITTSPFQTIENCSAYGLRIIGKDQTFWVPNHYEVAKVLQSLNRLYTYSTCHLGDTWLLFSERYDTIDIARCLIATSSALTHAFLSRVRLHGYLKQLKNTHYITAIYTLASERLFNSLHIQRNMFDDYEPTIETMREDLRTGYWIT
jgi:hypothetical protein